MNEEKLFSDLMEYHVTIFRICLGFTKDPYEAEDLTQDIYLKAYSKLDSLREASLKKPWLLRITRNTCINHLNKKKKTPLFSKTSDMEPVSKGNPEYVLLQNEDHKEMKKNIHKLPKKLREVLILHEYASLSYKEISEVLKIKEGTVMSRLNRARQFIIKKMREKNHG
jgi:RNA polymerase sigma-70 factor (ECF subfamily)